ncbi:MAG: efflux RND transporter periplasmic adaptor subunit [Candidatus Hydrogenedentes bacterium]|nr:efflux RND transporter periplasmic adaptor subunit [Candidatus Hydrogenedentota bacterium]
MKTLALATFLILPALLAGCGATTPEGDPEESQPAVVVHVIAARTESIRPTLNVVGTLVPVPEQTAVVSPAIAGVVQAVTVHEGDAVKAGETLVALDGREHEAGLAKARAALNETGASLAMVERGPLPQEIEAARQEARNAEAAAESQRVKLKALESLFEKGEISSVQFEQAKAAAASSEAAAKAAQQRGKLAQNGSRQEMIDEAKAKLAGAQAEVAAQELAVQQCSIQSPIDGVVTELSVRQGMYVEQPTALGKVIDLSSLFVQVRVPSKFRGQVQERAKATVKANWLGEQAFEGRLERLSKQADAQSGDTDAFVLVDNQKEMLQPGLSASVTIDLPEIADAVVVPVAAVADHNGTAVVTVIRDGKAYETEVQTGVRTPEVVQILSGLAAGEIVATEGGYGLPDGCPVSIVSIKEDSGK